CYYYRLNRSQREKYNELISTKTIQYNINIKLDLIVKREQDRYIRALTIPPGIATNRAFSENLFVMLVGLATKTPTIIVGRPVFIVVLYAKINLLKYTDIIPMLKKRWDDAVEFQDTLRKVAKQKEGDKKKDPISPAGNAANATSNRSVVLWLDEVGLAEHSPHRPLKVLHKLLEDGNPTIAFIGLSNWKLDAAKMNRMVLHQVTQPDDQEL
ncbi:hypothetical protein RFI_34925, partial [Reticulomyxa filosa]